MFMWNFEDRAWRDSVESGAVSKAIFHIQVLNSTITNTHIDGAGDNPLLQILVSKSKTAKPKSSFFVR